jgi:hypothetical protein
MAEKNGNNSNDERRTKLATYNPYVEELANSTIGDVADRGGPDHIAMLAIAYEIAQLRATIKFGGK